MWTDPVQIGDQLYVYIEIDAIQVIAGAPTPVTYRFGDHGTPAPSGIAALPILLRHETQPARLALAQGLGIRERVRFVLSDFLNDGDVAGGDPAESTTFWRLFRARIPFISGRPVRQIRGTISGGVFTATDTMHYIVRKIEGPHNNASVTIEAEDLTGTLARGNAQCPIPSRVTLLSPLTTGSIGAQVTPSADLAEWQDSGWLRIGDEVMQYAISESPDGAFLTLANRGSFGTLASDHEAGTTVQPVAYWDDARVCDIMHDLLVTYAGIPSEQIPLAEWQAKDDKHLAFRLTALIWTPTDVDWVVGDLLRSFPVAVWYDPRIPTWGFLPFDAAAIDRTLQLVDDGDYIADSLMVREDPDRVWTRLLVYYGPRDYTDDLKKIEQYQVARLFVNTQAETLRGKVTTHSLPVLWLLPGQDVDADRIGQGLQRAGRYDDRVITMRVPIGANLRTGDYFLFRSRRFVDAEGGMLTARLIVIGSKEIEDGAQLEIECRDLHYYGKYRVWSPDAMPNYDAASTEQQETYLFYADDDDTLGAAGDPAHTWL